MKKFISIVFIMLFIVMLLPQISNAFHSSNTMNCNDTIGCCDRNVYIGDYKYTIIRQCGNPDYKDIVLIGTSCIKLEHWSYVLDDVVYYLVLTNGKVTRIEWEKR